MVNIREGPSFIYCENATKWNIGFQRETEPVFYIPTIINILIPILKI